LIVGLGQETSTGFPKLCEYSFWTCFSFEQFEDIYCGLPADKSGAFLYATGDCRVGLSIVRIFLLHPKVGQGL